jgi:hypothetical protein
VIEVQESHVDVWRRYPYHGQEKIIQFSTETREYEKYTDRIEGRSCARLEGNAVIGRPEHLRVR